MIQFSHNLINLSECKYFPYISYNDLFIPFFIYVNINIKLANTTSSIDINVKWDKLDRIVYDLALKVTSLWLCFMWYVYDYHIRLQIYFPTIILFISTIKYDYWWWKKFRLASNESVEQMNYTIWIKCVYIYYIYI